MTRHSRSTVECTSTMGRGLDASDEVCSRAYSPLCVSPPRIDDHPLGSDSSPEPDLLQANENMSSDDEFAGFTSSPDEECPSKFCTWSVGLQLHEYIYVSSPIVVYSRLKFTTSLYFRHLFVFCRRFRVLG